MLKPRSHCAIFITTFFLLEAYDMSNHAISFESTQTGVAPEGWTATLTGSGDPKWTVEGDETAPSKSNVLKQSGQATYPLILKNDTNIQDGTSVGQSRQIALFSMPPTNRPERACQGPAFRALAL
jgi:hypothetical protein